MLSSDSQCRTDFDVQYFSIFAPFSFEMYEKTFNMKLYIYIIMQARMHMHMRPYIVGAQPDMYACEPTEDGVQDSLSRTAYISYMNAFWQSACATTGVLHCVRAVRAVWRFPMNVCVLVRVCMQVIRSDIQAEKSLILGGQKKKWPVSKFLHGVVDWPYKHVSSVFRVIFETEKIWPL